MLKMAGDQTVTATDTANNSVIGSSPTIKVVIGQNPVLAPIGSKTILLGQTLTFTALATDPNDPASPLAFSLDAGTPAGATIDPTTGVFSWRPTSRGNFSATVRVRNTLVPTLTAYQAVSLMVTTGTITGTVYFDDNANGVRDANEAGLGGRTVYLDLNGNAVLDSGEPTTTADGNGSYMFSNLTIGSYSVRLDLPYPNVALTVPPRGGRDVIVGSGITSKDIDFGLVPYNIAYPVHPQGDLYGPHPSADANTAFIKGLYRGVLGRDADADGIKYWLRALASGTARDQAAWQFINSTEHRYQEMDTYYRAFLGRTASDPSSAYWVHLLQADGDESEVIIGILASDGYKARRPNDADYITDLYALLLGRTPDAAGLDYWKQRLRTGTSRHDVVDGFLHSHEAGELMAESYYATFLHRPSDAGREYWITLLTNRTATYGQMAADFLGSDEFYQKAGQSVP